MGPWRGHGLFLLISPALLMACHSSPEGQLEKVRQELASWDATQRLTAELSQEGALPPVYVRQVSEAVTQGREKARQQAAKISQ